MATVNTFDLPVIMYGVKLPYRFYNRNSLYEFMKPREVYKPSRDLVGIPAEFLYKGRRPADKSVLLGHIVCTGNGTGAIAIDAPQAARAYKQLDTALEESFIDSRDTLGFYQTTVRVTNYESN